MTTSGQNMCNNCIHLIEERLPQGAAIKRCMKVGAMQGRTVNYSSIGTMYVTYTPVWCTGAEHVDQTQNLQPNEKAH